MISDLMGEGFILLTRGYGFMGGVYHLPFDTLKKGTSAYDINRGGQYTTFVSDSNGPHFFG